MSDQPDTDSPTKVFQDSRFIPYPAPTPSVVQVATIQTPAWPLLHSSLLIRWSLVVSLGMIGHLQARAADEPSSRTLIEQAKQLEQAQQYDDAVTLYRAILQQHPENDEIRGALARLLSWQGAHVEAADLYRTIMRRHPADLDVRTALARVLSWHTDRKEAQHLYEQVLRENPRHVEALRGLGDLLFWEERPDDALPYYEQAFIIERDPTVAERIASIKGALRQSERPSSATILDPTGPHRADRITRAQDREQTGKYGEPISATLDASPQAPLGPRDSTIRLPFRDYLKVGYGHFVYSRGIPDERSVLIEVSKSLGAQTLIARVEPIHRFGFHDTVFSAEGYSPLWRRAWGYLAGQGSINPDFSPTYSFVGEAFQGLGGAHPLLTIFEASFGYRHLSYKTDDINLLLPGLTVFLPFHLWLTEKLYYVPETGAITLSSRLTWRPTPRLQIFASGSFGTSGERIVATQDVTRISGRTIQGGIVLPVADRISLELTGYDEDRGALYTRRGAGFSVMYHW